MSSVLGGRGKRVVLNAWHCPLNEDWRVFGPNSGVRVVTPGVVSSGEDWRVFGPNPGVRVVTPGVVSSDARSPCGDLASGGPKMPGISSFFLSFVYDIARKVVFGSD